MVTPPPDSSPPYSGLGHIPGLDRDKVEKERKDMWGQIFKKYEDLEQRNELSGEVSLEDIDNPVTIHRIVKESSRYNCIKPSTILRRYFMEHADEIDEIATIAGPPASDEEVLTDDSDDEELSISSGTVSEDGKKLQGAQSPITPPTSESSDENNVDGNANSDEASNSDNNDTMIGYDDEDDVPLYNSMSGPDYRRNSDRDDQSLSLSHEPCAKKPRLQPEQPSNFTKQYPYNKLGQGVEAEGDDKIQVDAAADKEEKSKCLVCSKCHITTFYEALPSSPGFQCDECLVGEHMECEVEECGQCKYVGEVITLRRDAEVFGRVEKLTRRKISQV